MTMTKAEIMASPWYSHKRAQLEPLLKDNETYTAAQVESLLRGVVVKSPDKTAKPQQ